MEPLSQEIYKKILVDPGYINQEAFDKALELAKQEEKSFDDALIDGELIRDDELGQLIARHQKVPFINLRQEKIDENILKQIPEIVAMSKGVIAYARDVDTVRVGMTDPNDMEMIQILTKKFQSRVRPYYITKRDLEKALELYRADIRKDIERIVKEIDAVADKGGARDSLIIKLVDLILEYGQLNNASDIHIEPLSDKVVIRYRIDSVMHKVFEFPKALIDPILSRIKILSKIRTDEHRAAQDGKFQIKIRDEQVDVRVSVVPITAGENLVMRLLSSKTRQLSLNDLGFSSKDLEKLKSAIKKPHGMVLVTGPTGSGKTTTIYEMLKILNTREVHIATIEDPVEYDIEGISQTQVNPRTNLTFAQGLRALVRQDPDIIMVGEIRDQETAQIAINSAMTGHLVLSTIHANNSATTIPRLLDMGIEPFLMASTINAIISQRLVRKLCEKCRYSYEIGDEDLEIINSDEKIKELIEVKYKKNINKLTLFKSTGCKICSKTGFRGRIGIYEILEMVESVKKHVINKSSSDEILETARANGMTTMLEDGLKKVFNGITTLEEVFRVTRD